MPAIVAVLAAALLSGGAAPALAVSGGSDSPGARALATDWYFAEGTTRSGFTTYIAVSNPNALEARLTFDYMLGSGAPVVREHVAAANSRFTIDVSADVGGEKDVSTSLHSSVPVVAERPMYFKYARAASTGVEAEWDGGHDSLGANAPGGTWYFAEGTTRWGFVTYIAVMNPSDAEARLDLTYMLETGETVVKAHVAPPRGRYTLNMADDVGPGYHDTSTLIQSSLPVVAERMMYFKYQGALDGGHDSLGAAAPATEWYFAEGTTRAGFTTYLTVMNPAEVDAVAHLSYMLGDGRVVDRDHAVKAHSRFTLDVSEDVGGGADVSTRLTSSQPVVAERPMYFKYQGAWDGGHDSMGVTSPACDWHFAEGTTRAGYATYLAVMNPDDAEATVAVTYMLGSGAPVNRTIKVGAHTRSTIDVAGDVGPERDVAAALHSDVAVVVERPMYFGTPRNGVTVCIDAGHSGRDGSEIDPATGLNVGDNTGPRGERESNWYLALIVKAELEDAGYDVRLTKQDVDDYLSLAQRAEIANSCAMMVRLHYDPSGFTGVMRPPVGAARCPTADPSRITVVDRDVAVASDALARCIAPAMGLQVRDDTGGTTQGNTTPQGYPTCLIGSLLSTVPIVTIENESIVAIPESLQWLEHEYARGLVRGIDAYLSSRAGQPPL